MMTTGYLVFPTATEAQARSHAEALARGCKAGDVTQFWWEFRTHPSDPTKTLLLVDDVRPDFAKTALSTVEKTQLGTDPTVLAALTATVVVTDQQSSKGA